MKMYLAHYIPDFTKSLQVFEDGSMEPYYVKAGDVGKKISTKSVGSNLRNDITDEYKYDEGKRVI